MKIVRALHMLSTPLCLRELVYLTGLSLAGVQDVLRRLAEQKVVRSSRKGNKILYSLDLNELEANFLNKIIKEQTKLENRKRAKIFCAKKDQAIGWIDETVRTWRKSKQKLHDPAKAS